MRIGQVFLTCCVVALVAIGLWTSGAHGASAIKETPADLLATAAQAQAAYERGIELRRTDPTASAEFFRTSVRDWRSLVEAGANNGPVYYNLGNAYMQSGDVGNAIASYLRAERRMPGDPDLKQNLAQARSAVQQAFAQDGNTQLVESVMRWWHVVPLWLREGGAWLAWSVFWTALLLTLLAPQRVGGTHTRNSIRRLTIASSLVIWCLLGGTLVADQVLHTFRPQGVLTSKDVVLRKGNGDGFEPAFAETLSPGVEFSIREERPGWLRIELPDGRSGWVKSTQAERV
jgi:hypothetical protein